MKIRNDFVTNSSSSSFIIVPKSKENEQYLTGGYGVLGFEDFNDFLSTYVEDEIDVYYDEDEFVKFNELLGVELTKTQWKLITHLTHESYEADDLLKIKHLIESGKTAYYTGTIDNNSEEYIWFKNMSDEIIIQNDY